MTNEPAYATIATFDGCAIERTPSGMYRVYSDAGLLLATYRTEEQARAFCDGFEIGQEELNG